MPISKPAIIKSLTRDERGVVAILFGLCALALLLSVGIAVDQARVYHEKSKIAAAADAAALAAGRAMMDGGMTDAEIADYGERFFLANLPGGGTFSVVNNIEVIPNRADSSIEVRVDAGVPMTFMRIAGVEDVGMPVDSSTTFGASDLELGMALDITGSMWGGKLADLKDAASELVEILLPDDPGPNKVRIGLAPYSASVQLGPYASAVSNGTSTDGCVRERTGASAHNDASIADGGFYRGGGPKLDVDNTEGWQGYSCPSAQILPLTDDRDVLTNSINSYNANGATAGHLGAQWAWNLVSPNFSTLWPADSAPVAYGDLKTIKAVILMTDGIFNTAYVGSKSGAQALSICQGLGDAGVVVHTVAFAAPPAAKTLLQDCATRAGGEFHDATDGEQLRKTFRAIASSLNGLRLTN